MFRKLIKKDDGSAMVEFALMLPLILVLVFGYIFFMDGVKTHIIMQTAAREGARAYANPIADVDMNRYGRDVAIMELNSNNIKGARVVAYADEYDRVVEIEKPYSTRFPLKRFNLKAYAVFQCEPYDYEE